MGGLGIFLWRCVGEEGEIGKLEEENMMEATLGVITCDKCGELMNKGQDIIVIAEGVIDKANTEIDFQGSSVRYACHRDCWDGVEEG